MSHNQPFDGRRAVIALTCAMAAGTMYVLAPAGLSWRYFNEQFKTH